MYVPFRIISLTFIRLRLSDMALANVDRNILQPGLHHHLPRLPHTLCRLPGRCAAQQPYSPSLWAIRRGIYRTHRPPDRIHPDLISSALPRPAPDDVVPWLRQRYRG